MAQSINIIHPEETVLNYTENSRYRYNGENWIKNQDIYVDRYINKDISEVIIDPSKVKYKSNYYIELSETYKNILLQSEALKESVWENKNLSVISNPNNFSFPNNVYPAFELRPTVGSTNVDHIITQQFIAKLNSFYTFSTFIRDVPESTNHKIALIIKDLRYNVLLSAEVDLETIYTFNDDIADISIKFLNSNTYQEISGINDYFSNYSAHIQRIKKNDMYYYRPYIKFKIKNSTCFAVGVIILDKNGNYKYSISDISPVFYMSGAQLEEYKTDSISTVSPYMITYKTAVQHIIPVALYGINSSNVPVLLPNNKIYYLDDVKEETLPNGAITIVSSKPQTSGSKNGDLALLQSTISFGTISSEIKDKQYPNWTSNKLYNVGDKIKYLTNIFNCVQTHTSSSNFISDISNWNIVLDAVGLGFSESDSAPHGSIYYDSKEKVYKIKESTENGDQWSVLQYNSIEVIKHDITHALIFNQGIFETWNQQSCLIKPRHELGYNTGGNYNFVKLSSISKKL